MMNQEIYAQALAILAQNISSIENEDFEERTPYLIASFCIEVQAIDQKLRASMGLAPSAPFDKTWIALDSEFPLVARLSPIAALYVAAMLILDEDGELSDKLYERYCDQISSVSNEICGSLEPIANPYFAD